MPALIKDRKTNNLLAAQIDSSHLAKANLCKSVCGRDYQIRILKLANVQATAKPSQHSDLRQFEASDDLAVRDGALVVSLLRKSDATAQVRTIYRPNGVALTTLAKPR